MLSTGIDRQRDAFTDRAAFLQDTAGAGREIGRSEGGRPIVAFSFGSGPVNVSLVAGAHADEPVGPETLRWLVRELGSGPERYADFLDRVRLSVIPHINPDGEARNRLWREKWPSVQAYIRNTVRELPGRDVEFNYPDRRPENEAVAGWLTEHAMEHGPFHVHASLHGMGFSTGAMLLIERNWTYRTEQLQDGYRSAAADAGLRMHDHNRKGEKGFFYVGPGFTTTPEGAAMRTYFRSHGDDETAALFGDSSMEFVRSLGGDPLSIVTELPLFVLDGPVSPGVPDVYLQFRDALPAIRRRLEKGGDAGDLMDNWSLDPLPVPTAMRLQVRAVELAIDTVEDAISRTST